MCNFDYNDTEDLRSKKIPFATNYDDILWNLRINSMLFLIKKGKENKIEAFKNEYNFNLHDFLKNEPPCDI